MRDRIGGGAGLRANQHTPPRPAVAEGLRRAALPAPHRDGGLAASRPTGLLPLAWAASAPLDR